MIGQTVNSVPVGQYIYFNSKGSGQTQPAKLNRVQKLCTLVQRKKLKSSTEAMKKFAGDHLATSNDKNRRAAAHDLNLHLLHAPRNADGALQMTAELRDLVNGVINPNGKKPTAPEQRPVELNWQASKANRGLENAASLSESATTESIESGPAAPSPVAPDSSQTPSIAMKREERKQKVLAAYELKRDFARVDPAEELALSHALAQAEEATYDALMTQQAINSAWALLTALPEVESCRTPLEKAIHYINNTSLLTMMGPKQREWFIEHYLDLFADHDKLVSTQQIS